MSWGVIEKSEPLDVTRDHVARALAATDDAEDVWLFSSADAIETVLGTSSVTMRQI